MNIGIIRLSQQKEFDYQRGVVLVEMAFVIPIVVFILLGLVELGTAMIQYSTLTQIAHEGVRLASSTPDVKHASTTSFSCGFAGKVCYAPMGGPMFSATSGNHEQLSPAVFRMVQLVNVEQMNLKDNMSISVDIQENGISKPVDVTVTIKVRPTGLSGLLLGSQPVEIRAKGPYLFS